MAQYLTTTDVDAVIGQQERKALFDDTAPYDGSTYASGVFSRCVGLASAAAQSAAINQGHDSGITNTDLLRLATLSIFIPMAYARKGRSPPAAVMTAIGNVCEGIRTGALPIPGADPAEEDAVGGSQWTEVDTSVSGAQPTIYGDGKLRRYY